MTRRISRFLDFVCGLGGVLALVNTLPGTEMPQSYAVFFAFVAVYHWWGRAFGLEGDT